MQQLVLAILINGIPGVVLADSVYNELLSQLPLPDAFAEIEQTTSRLSRGISACFEFGVDPSVDSESTSRVIFGIRPGNLISKPKIDPGKLRNREKIEDCVWTRIRRATFPSTSTAVEVNIDILTKLPGMPFRNMDEKQLRNSKHVEMLGVSIQFITNSTEFDFSESAQFSRKTTDYVQTCVSPREISYYCQEVEGLISKCRQSFTDGSPSSFTVSIDSKIWFSINEGEQQRVASKLSECFAGGGPIMLARDSFKDFLGFWSLEHGMEYLRNFGP